MGVYRRPDSPYWWIYLEKTGARQRTDFRIGTTAAQKRDSRASADELHHTLALAAARDEAGLTTTEPAAPIPTFETFAAWYDEHVSSHHAGAEREREILTRLRVVFGAYRLDEITRAVVIEWRTARRAKGVTVDRMFGIGGSPSRWRQVHELLKVHGPKTLAEIRAHFPASTRDVCSTILSHAAAPYFRRVARGVWAAIGTPKMFRQKYAPPSAATVNREVDVLQQVLSAAVEAGHLDHSPLYGLKNLPIVKPIRRTMSEAEERLILSVLAPDDQAILLVGLDTLARLINILDLQWDDVHDRTLDIRDPKNGESHTVPLSARVRAALALLPRSGRYCFPRRRLAASEAARRKTIAGALKRACGQVGLPYGRVRRGLTFHWSTRRTGATRMIQRGGEKAIAVVQRIGNWKDANVLIGIYQETITAEMEAAVETVGAQVGADLTPKTGQVIHALFTKNRKIPQ